jgi:hypothetical protein
MSRHGQLMLLVMVLLALVLIVMFLGTVQSQPYPMDGPYGPYGPRGAYGPGYDMRSFRPSFRPYDMQPQSQWRDGNYPNYRDWRGNNYWPPYGYRYDRWRRY